MKKIPLQLTPSNQLRHFLSIKTLDRLIIEDIFNTADSFFNSEDKTIITSPVLRDKTIANLFFETSTRTRSTFELAEKKLGATVLNLNIEDSASVKKGESLLDTIANLHAMECDALVIRHPQSGSCQFIAEHCKNDIAIINAGDGCHEHPTQAMLDMFTIKHHKPNFHLLKVAIVGDILHSRVARSQIYALHLLGAHEIRAISPQTLLPAHANTLGITCYRELEPGLEDIDVIILLRLQQERMQTNLLPSKQEYFSYYGLTKQRLALAKPDAILMHPGPVNHNIEVEANLLNHQQSVILEQVHRGLAIRMAIIKKVLCHEKN